MGSGHSFDSSFRGDGMLPTVKEEPSSEEGSFKSPERNILDPGPASLGSGLLGHGMRDEKGKATHLAAITLEENLGLEVVVRSEVARLAAEVFEEVS